MDMQRSAIPDVSLECIFSHLEHPSERKLVSLVCHQWKLGDQNTRKHVQISNCYSVAPTALSKRFPNLESLKIKGRPRASEFGLLPHDWGGYAQPWVAEVAKSYVQKLQKLWLQRMLVTDDDLDLLAKSCSDSLRTLKLHKCSGFSAIGIASITASCRFLKVLFIEECVCEAVPSNNAGEWLRRLAQDNSNLEELNFQYTDGLKDIFVKDLEAVVENCKSLRSLKVNEIDMMSIKKMISRSSNITELGAGRYNELNDLSPSLETTYPPSIISLSGLYYLSGIAIPLISALLPNLKKLDLVYVDLSLSQDDHCEILRCCVNLEELEARNDLGDAGLRTISNTCVQLRRIRISDSVTRSILSPGGIIPLAENCVKLEFLVMYVSDINNATLVAIAKNCKVMKDCRFVLLPDLPVISDLPLDEGVKALLNGCPLLTRFALYLRNGALTDRGMSYIGQFGGKLKWILLGCPGESDSGLQQLAAGCEALERLEIRSCNFTEAGLTAAAKVMKSLKYLWVQGCNATDSGGRLMKEALSYWNVEIYLGSADATLPGHLTAYHSLVGGRTDCPPDIKVFSNVGGLPAHENGLI